MTRTSTTALSEQPVRVVTAESVQTMGLLREQVPISLIMDLSGPAGPGSKDIFDTEGAPDGTWWIAP